MLTVLRKLFSIFVLLVILLCAGIWWLSNNANDTIKEQIELQGSRALGTNVIVGSVNLNLRGAGLKINDLKVVNLPGYTKENLLEADRITILVSPKSLFNKLVNVKNVTIEGAEIYAELKGEKINFQELADRLNANTVDQSKGESTVENEALKDVRMRMGEFKFRSANMNLFSQKYGSITVPAPYIQLNNIGGEQGLPIDQFADAFLTPFITQLKAAGKQLIYEEIQVRLMHKIEAERIRAEAKLKEKEKELKKKYEAEIKAKEDQLKGKLKEKEDEIKSKLEDKLKNLF